MIRPKERLAIIRSLSSGVVPAIGLQHIQVGRRDEVAAVINDLNHVGEGASSIRFIVGRFGTGKSFFLNLMRNVALSQKFVVLNADITTERRLHGTAGKARALYSELMSNLSTATKPEGGALPNLVERWVGEIDHSITSAGGTHEDVAAEIDKNLSSLRDMVNGFDFAKVLMQYYKGYCSHNEALQAAALRWLRAEYGTKTEAREDLGIRSTIEDEHFYESLKLFAKFVRLAGYKGLMVSLDELVVLSHRLNNSQARNNNYEAILKILNDSLQGRSEGLAFVFAGTDECLEDRRRGLFSYEALATRLASNRYATEGIRDLSGPVIKLQSLSAEDCYVLLRNVRNVFASGDSTKHLIPDEAITLYLTKCQERLGGSFYQTPRDTVKDFTGFLQVLEQNPNSRWQELLAGHVPQATTVSNEDSFVDDDLSGFRL